MTLLQILKRIAKDEAGATAIEYGLIIALIALSALGALSGLAGENTNTWSTVSTEFADSSQQAREGL